MDQACRTDRRSYYTGQLLQLQASCSTIQAPSGSWGWLHVNFMQHAGLWGQLGSPTQHWHGAHTVLIWIGALSSKWANEDCTGLRTVKPSFSDAPVFVTYIFFLEKEGFTEIKIITHYWKNRLWEPVGKGLRHRFSNRFPQTETNGLALRHRAFQPVP